MVLLGRGRMRFSPPDPAERTQIRIFRGRDELVEEIDMVFLRFSPCRVRVAVRQERAEEAGRGPGGSPDRDQHLQRSRLRDRFRSTSATSAAIAGRWRRSFGDVIAELRTKRFGTLTYARSGSEAEDINVFDRKRRRNISIYTSAEKLAERGRFYSEDERLDFDVLAYDHRRPVQSRSRLDRRRRADEVEDSIRRRRAR